MSVAAIPGPIIVDTCVDEGRGDAARLDSGAKGGIGAPGGAMPVSPEAFNQLQEAFRAFSDASVVVAEHYARLESRLAQLNVELEEANARLHHNLAENQKMRDYLSTLLESLPVGVIGVDGSGRVCSLNRRAAEILGCDSQLVVGREALGLLGLFGDGKP